MKRTIRIMMVAAALGALLAAGAATALGGTSSPGASGGPTGQWNKPPEAPAVGPYLLIETIDTSTSIRQVLSDRGITYTSVSGSDWTGLDLSGYQTVIIGMDGGSMSAASVQTVATWVQGGGCLIMVGGSCWEAWAQGVNASLVENNTGSYCWSTPVAPQLTVTDPTSPLADGLPATYNFTNGRAGVYSIRVTDPAIEVAAVNGDGYPALFSKVMGSGRMVWFINSPYYDYWNDGDYPVFASILGNALDSCGEAPPPVPATTPWGLALLGTLLAAAAMVALRRKLTA